MNPSPPRWVVLFALLAIGVPSPLHAQTLPFTYETLVGLGGPASYVDMQRDGSGRAHMSYYDNATQQLKYTYRSGSGYETEIITGDASGPHSMALDPQGRPCIAYSLRSPGGLNFLTRTGLNTWTNQVITTTATNNPDLTINSFGKAAVSFRNTVISRLQYSERPVGGGWSLPFTPDNADINGLKSALVLNAAGDPRIVYKYSNTHLKYAERNGATWAPLVVLASHDVNAMDIVLTSLEEPRAVAYDNAGGRIQYYQRLGAVWSGAVTLQAVGASNLFVNCRITVDSADNPRVSYHHISAQSLRYAARSGATWTLYDVDTSFPNTGAGNALALDASGFPLLAYSSGTPPSLKFAHSGVELYEPNGGEAYPFNYSPYVFWGGIGTFTIEASEDDGFSWSYQATVTGNSPYNYSTSVRTPPFISAQCRVRVTRTSPAGAAQSAKAFLITPGMNRPWVFGGVDNAGRVGNRPSIATDGTMIGISYYDSTNGDLKFASRCLDGPWTVEPIQTAGNAGFYSSTKIVNGTAYVLYFDSSAGLLKLATRSYGAWSTQNVYSGSASSPSLAVQSNGVPHVAFWSSNEIKYGYKNGATWVFETVDQAGLSGECSIALTSANAPRIAYFSQWWSPQTGPRYGVRLGPDQWGHETMETGTSYGFGISLTHNAGDFARISYIDNYNSWSKKVRVASKQTVGWTASSIRTTAGDMGLFTSIAVNASDEVSVVYSSNKMFQYFGPGTSGGSYISDLGITPIGRASITVTPSGAPLIAAHDLLNGDLFTVTDMPDQVAPAPVNDLYVGLARYGSAVSWVDSGDDGMTCNATFYEVRQHWAPINNELAWSSAIVIASGAPSSPGTSHCIELATSPCSPYWFAARMRDDAGHWSALGTTAGGTTPCTGFSIPACAEYAKNAPAEEDPTPATLELGAISPNPIRDAGTIRLGIPQSNVGAVADVAVFDVAGRRTATLHRGALAPGWHTIRWDRRGRSGESAESGMYYVRLRMNGETRVRSVLLLGN